MEVSARKKEELRKKEGKIGFFAMNLNPHRDEVIESSWGAKAPGRDRCFPPHVVHTQ